MVTCSFMSASRGKQDKEKRKEQFVPSSCVFSIEIYYFLPYIFQTLWFVDDTAIAPADNAPITSSLSVISPPAMMGTFTE